MCAVSLPILGFHQLSKELTSDKPKCSSESVDIFERYIQYLHINNYHCLSLPELIKYSGYKRLLWKKTVVLTFDDGFEDFFTLAYPILSRYGFSATIFIVTDLVGGKSNWEGENGTPLLSWEQIKILHDAGCTFGSHTCSHPRLLCLSDEQIWHELTVSKKCLEDRLSQEIQLLAYPHGESNSRIQHLAMAAGYKMACGLMQGKTGRYNLSRSSCGPEDNLETLINVSSRRYELRRWFRDDTHLGQFLHNVKHRSFLM
jgi:peptidoglycan/xylan/chitin deacetylase (PgdA/CDA1 family)